MNKVELTINGNKYNFHFGLGFHEKVMDGENLPDGNILNVKPIRLMYYSASFAAEVRGDEFINIYQWYDILDELNAEEYSDVVNSFLVALFKSMQKKLNLAPKEKKEFEKQIADLEKKLKPQKVATAAK